MERRWAARRDQLLADAEVDPRIPRGVLPRLERFLDPFVQHLQRSEQAAHARRYVTGETTDTEPVPLGMAYGLVGNIPPSTPFKRGRSSPVRSGCRPLRPRRLL